MASLAKALRLHPQRDLEIARLSGPIVGGMLSQTLLNLVDTAMVGRLDAASLAAVGLGSVSTWLCVSILLGIGSATQALVARRVGEQRPRAAGRVLDTALVLGGGAGVLVGLAIYLLTPQLMGLLSRDGEVVRLGTAYLRYRTIGFPFVVMNFALRGFYHGIGDTRTYLKAILVVNVTNGVLDVLLIFGLLGFPRMESAGAGLATALGLAAGTLYYLVRAVPRTRLRARFGAIRLSNLSRTTARSLVAIVVPSGLQGLGTALGFIAFFWMMARIDTVAVAVTNLLVNISSAFHLPALGMGLAAATLVGQSLGRREPAEAEAWGWETVRLSVYILGAAGILMALIPGPVLRIFTDESEVIESGKLALQVLGLGQFATCITMVMTNVMISAGCARSVMAINVGSSFLIALPLVYVFCVWLGGGVALAWLFMGIGRLAAGLALMLMFRVGRWKAFSI
jgi:putative MATE family efflux protein